MRSKTLKALLKTAALAITVLLLGAVVAFGQQQINLTAGPTTLALPDGTLVPMWGYTCGTAVTNPAPAATCANLNPLAPPATATSPAGWSPVVITVPYVATGTSLTINLTNNLTFQPPTPASGTAPAANTIPTSLVIVGQLGGGLGVLAQRTTDPATAWDHSNAQGATTWPIAGGAGGTPPTQGPRVRSFSTEVVVGTPQSLTWSNLSPGTYLLESGTHPSIQGPMGLYGMVVVTTAPSGSTAGTAYPAVGTTVPAVNYNAEVPLLFSEIDAVQNAAVNAAVNTAGFSETRVWSGQPADPLVSGSGCGNPASPAYHTCYPPAVNYTPLYYLINGVAFDKTHASASLFPSSPATGLTAGTGSVLVRLVNAGLRMHVPSIVGSQTGTAVAPATVPPAGFSLIAEDGNRLPGVPRVQSEVFMAAGKTYDVMVNVPAAGGTALPIYDRQLSLSANTAARDAGMLAYIGINGAGLPAAPAIAAAQINTPTITYNSLVPCPTTTPQAPCTPVVVSDPSKGLIAGDTNANGVQLMTVLTTGTLILNADGTFTYTPNPGTGAVTFMVCVNGTVTAGVCSSGLTETVTLGAATLEAASGITVANDAYTSNVATTLSIKPPGILANDRDGAGYPLTVNAASVTPGAGLTLSVDANGGFNASVAAAGTYSFTYKAQNSQGTPSAGTATVTLTFPAANAPTVTVKDPTTGAAVTDYRWIIEEDRTFYINPACTSNPPPTGCPVAGVGIVPGTSIVPAFGTNFHTSYMPVVAAGCVGTLACESGQTLLGAPAVCDVGNGVCRTGASQQTPLDPSKVHLDPTKRYYISVLPGDAANPFNTANAVPGHGMGGAQIACIPTAPAVTCTSTGTFQPVTVLTEPNPFQPAKLSVFVFEDDFPLNGEQDGGGGIDVLSPNEPGLGGFEITLFDDAGGTGDATGQLTHDMFNQPLSNSLAGTKDPITGLDACPITPNPLVGVNSAAGNTPGSVGTLGITGRIVTCPKYESDGKTLSPLAGQAVIANMMAGRYGVVATPAADRIARNEEWLQTNTLDGQKAHDSFLRIGEPGYFQEYGPAGYHVSIGFANPKIINARLPGICSGADPNSPQPGAPYNCNNTVKGIVSTARMSRTPDERLYGSGDNSSFSFTQCYVSFGDPDGEDFAFTKCNSDGTFSLSGLPDGDWRITIFDQWNDMLVDGLSTPVRLATSTAGTTVDLGQVATNQWQANIYTSTFFDANGNGVRDSNEAGLTLVSTNIRFRDGSYSNFNNTDLNGNAGFNEVFPLFSWYVIETDSTRYKTTGIHVVYDAGGPSDGTPGCGGTAAGAPAPCGNSTIAANMANTYETVPLPNNLRVPGAFYCATADCTDAPAPLPSPLNSATSGGAGGSTGRVDPPWVVSEGWQGFSGQNNFLEFGKKPFAVGENGGIRGEVNYASTRPFDDPQLVLHVSWTPDVPNVTVNLYQEGFAPDGVTPTLKLIDTTQTTSWDNWAQGFRSDGIPNMNCPGQGGATGTNADLFFFSLYDQPNYLDWYNSQHGGPAARTLPNNSQFKCYDGMHNWNQLQPAVYDGMYQFPSVTGINPTTGKPTGTNCTACIPNPDTTDPYRAGAPMLPAGKYVVEVVVPPGYELLKEEDKNILIGDNYIAPVTQQFGALGSIFIMPDQAAIGASYNANNAQNPTQDLGTLHLPRGEGDTGSVEQFWPCVGASRIVPDYISLFPGSVEVSPFAGATRNLCDRKEVTLQDQTSALAKFYIFSSAHVAAHYTGVITDDYTSEFDPFSPQFGEKFSPPNLPISIKDFNGNEISRTYADHWGTYDGLNYSTWEVNPPNPTGYAPTMMVTCMNDPGPILDTRPLCTSAGVPAGCSVTGGQMIPDPLYTSGYSQFCYEIPFMPGQTQYMDTPVVPTSAFAGAGYNNVDCSYPDATPAIKEVDGDGLGPWLNASGALTLTITALGDQFVPNYAYSGPSATTAPYNQKTVMHHYGFGARPTTCGNGANCPNVTIGGISAVVQSWSDTTITATARAVGQIPLCAVQQQALYGGSQARCGELVITAANGKQSIDTVTVTIGGKAPTHVAASASIQAAIDAAAPGDMIVVDPAFTPSPSAPAGTSCATATAPSATCVATAANHNEILLMWKPVRLQGVGAATSIINANTHPAGKLDVWRAQVNCLFGLALNGQPVSGANPFDPQGKFTCPGTGWNYFNPTTNNPQIDRLPLEATLGWDASLNGNLAELLQEPSLMGALEGAGITVLSKGVFFPSNPFDPTLLAGFPTGTVLFTNNPTNMAAYCNGTYTSNFQCNPSSIDGLGITDSSQGGGAVFVHGWGHNVQIANNRIYSNAGTLSGGINVGQGEFAPSYTVGGTTNAAPGSCMDTTASGPGISIINPTLVAGQQLPYCENMNVNVHHNDISLNSSTGDELFSATPAGAGGVSFCTGSDYYKFNYNWVCGNMSSGDGGGIGHLGFSWNGDIEHNTIIFNQSINPTIPANGGGLIVMGTPDVDPPCGATTDTDCVPPLGSVGPSDGIGPGLVINANLIQGNSAESGSGGGIAFQNINGAEVVAFPTDPTKWYSVQFTNNIVSDNVAGWDGAGISLLDALNMNIVNNTIVSNATTASSGMLFNTLGAPLASTQGPTCTANCGTNSPPQPAGLVSQHNSAVLSANLPLVATPGGPAAVPIVNCPAGHSSGGSGSVPNGDCRTVSYPLLDNNIFWQNSAGYIAVGSLGSGPLNQQNVVTLHNAFTGTLVANQTATGMCTSDRQYWDIGVRGDTGPTDHSGGHTLNPLYSILTPGSTGYSSTNLTGNPAVVSQYCDGSRTPPEFGASGWAVPPGISDATVPNPLFNLTPVATVDEGNNWVNMRWGPLSMTNPTVLGTDGNYGGGPALGNYAITAGSPAIDYVTPSSPTYAPAPSTDFFGNPRKTTTNPNVDVGAVEGAAAGSTGGAVASVTPTSLTFLNVVIGTTSAAQNLTLHNTGTATLTGIALAFTGPFSRITTGPFPAGVPNCGTTLAAGANCTIKVVFQPTPTSPLGGTLAISASVPVAGSPVGLTGTTVARRIAASFAPATWNPTATRGCGLLTCPVQVFTLTNTGNVPLTGITQGVITGATEFSVVRLLSTCGPAGGGQLLGQTTLAPGAACVITGRFAPPAADTTGTKNATLSVTDAAGTQTSTLTGTAN